MTEEKNIDAGKQPDKSQEKFTDEHLSENELDNVAGGVCGKAFDDTKPYGTIGNLIFSGFSETGK